MTYAKKAYRSPLAKVVEINNQGVLCQSEPYGENTEKFTLGSNRYSDEDWE